ncbi:MAG: metal ABC transporter solute-binding protein, Zn/Mn family [Fusobacteriota bacterium]
MLKKRITIIIILIAVGLVFWMNRKEKPKEESSKKVISVSILPQKYFVQKIVGNKFDINVVIPPGSSPATYDPAPKQMTELAESFLYFKIGYIPFESNYMDKIQGLNEDMEIIDTSKNVDLIKKGNKIDPHIWLSPSEVKKQVKVIKDAIIKKDSGNTEFYTKNYNNLINEIDELDSDLKDYFSKIKNDKILVYHPSWGYLARDYNFEQIAIEVDGKAPSPIIIKETVDKAREENINTIIVQKQFDTKSASVIADEIGGTVLHLDPLAVDWMENLREISKIISEN